MYRNAPLPLDAILLPSPPLHHLAHPQTTPIGWSVGAPEGVRGGGGRGGEVNHPSAKKFLIAAMLLWDEEDVGFVLFHFAIFNSLGATFKNVIKKIGLNLELQAQFSEALRPQK